MTQFPAEPYLVFDGISKSFPGVRALRDVTFACRAGEVHALLGENGAGKSTLLKTLSGVNKPDGGTLRLGGRAVAFGSTSDALRAGVAVIYQELHLVPEMTVAENLYLGHLPAAGGWVRRRELRDSARRWLQTLGEPINPRARVSSLSLGQRQMVEIAKALARDAKVIAFDEPTSSLSSRETERLFRVIEQLRADGRVILYVSHRLDEIDAICDSATVLRDGQHVVTFDTLDGVTRDELVRRMVGRTISDVWNYSPRPAGEVALSVDRLTGPGLTAPASFEVRAGEIVGFFGLIGAGRSELMKLVYGATRPTGGAIKLFGRPVTLRSPTQAIRAGLAFAPEDRKKEGIIPVAGVGENLILSVRRRLAHLGLFIRRGREREHSRDYVRKLAVKTPKLGQPIRLLSGGNQQKVILARWLSEEPRVLIVDEPTRGIDVGARSEIYAILYDLARRGVAVVVVSSELPEVMGISDRVLVMRQGRIVADVPRGQATQDSLLAAALPVEADEKADANEKTEKETVPA